MNEGECEQAEWAYMRMSRHVNQYFRPRSSMTRSSSFSHHFQQLVDPRASTHNKELDPSHKHEVDNVFFLATPALLRLAARGGGGGRAGYRK